jgi:tetratricopeptide (TPR) repeat protein
MRPIRTLPILFALAFTAVPQAVFAQQDAALTEAQARFKEGLDLADANNHEASRLKFQQAWSVYKSPAVLYNLARSEQLTGHDIEAFEHFREFLKMPPDPKVTEAHKRKA